MNNYRRCIWDPLIKFLHYRYCSINILNYTYLLVLVRTTVFLTILALPVIYLVYSRNVVNSIVTTSIKNKHSRQKPLFDILRDSHQKDFNTVFT